MKTSYTLLILILSMSFYACEKKINIDIKDASPKLVVSGYITNFNQVHEINITQSSNINEQDFNFISNATVNVTDNLGNVFPFTHSGSGKYISAPFQGIPGNTYTISVLYNNNNYLASSTMPQLVPLNSIEYKEENFSFDLPIEVVWYYWSDPSNTDNFYRFYDLLKGTRLTQRPFEYQLYDDQFSNGNNIERDGFNFYLPGDTVIAHLASIDEAVYTYYEQLRDVAGGGPGGQGIPYNPKSNFDSEDVLGYFGAWAVDTLQIVIP